jgi:hypothetical protein
MIAALEGDALIDFIGSDTAGKLRKHELSKIKNPVPQPAKAKEQTQEKDSRPQSPEEWLRKIKKEHGILK